MAFYQNPHILHLLNFFMRMNGKVRGIMTSHLTQLAFTSVSKIPNTRIMIMAIQYIPLLEFRYKKMSLKRNVYLLFQTEEFLEEKKCTTHRTSFVT